jgi:hypothetical protein
MKTLAQGVLALLVALFLGRMWVVRPEGQFLIITILAASVMLLWIALSFSSNEVTKLHRRIIALEKILSQSVPESDRIR